MNSLEKTSSICPICFNQGKIQKIDANLYEDQGKVWIQKYCQKHGSFKEIYFGDTILYKKWMKYKASGKPISYIKNNLSDDLELYTEHTSQTMLTNLVVTNRSNLKWDKIFFNAYIDGYVYEPSIEKLIELMNQSMNVNTLSSKSLQIIGGEPTLREDLFEIIRIAKKIGYSHIQLQTNGLILAERIDYCQRLKDEKVNSVYLNFNGITNLTNPLIDYQKKVIENLRKVNLNIFLHTAIIGNENVSEPGKIIRFALDNIDVIRGVHFYPFFLNKASSTPSKNQIASQRIDISQIFDSIEKEFFSLISRNDFYPTSIAYPISQLIESLIKQPQLEVTPHPGCGGSTLIFLKDGKPLPITRFIDVESLIGFLDKESKKKGPLRKLRFASALVKNIDSFTNNKEAPDGFDMKQMAKDAAIGGSDFAFRKYHNKTLNIGFMWYQDVMDLNFDRLHRCVIHCPTFEGIVPFCSYVGLEYGKKIHKKYSSSIKEWENKTGHNFDDFFIKIN